MRQTIEAQTSQAGQTEPTWRPESRFVPVRAADLARLLVEDADRFGQSGEGLLAAFHAIQETIECEATAFRNELEESYARFNPDRETIRLPEPPVAGAAADHKADPAAYAELHSRISYLLDKANYQRLDDIHIADTIQRANAGRIQVRIHPDRVKHLELWIRGHGSIPGKRRTLRNPIKGEEFDSPVFKRMTVVAQLKDDPNVMIKVFKDIPEAEIEALLPHAEATMTLLDRIKLFGSGAGVLGTTLMKLAKLTLLLTKLTVVLWIVLVGVATIALRTFFGYKNAKTTRDWRRTQRLYFQNLGNNASALQLLISSVKQEEIKEAYLAYAFALQNGGRDMSKNGLRRRIEAYLQEKLDVEVDFDINDAVETMCRLNLWGSGSQQIVLEPAQVFKTLQEYRTQGFSGRYHMECLAKLSAQDTRGGT